MTTKPTHKIINDPVYGFIGIDDALLLAVLDHPWMQRLRRIRQLGMTNLVYPGAQHTRFQHAAGAMHLMQMAIDTLKKKGAEISDDEIRGAMAAILMHDIGHGPFSHVLEHSIVTGISHETVSKILMHRMNEQMDGQLSLAIDTFEGNCKPFLHQLISSQLDTDRLDYLKRDSFFSGVTEGTIGSDRIIKMLNVVDNELVVEAKGVYSIEKFLIARRLMYWQVYLHKTVIAAEKMLIQILRRAKQLAREGRTPFAPPQLVFFLNNEVDMSNFDTEETIRNFALLDDNDIMSAIKTWTGDDDKILATLSSCFIDRRLFRIEISRAPFDEETLENHRNEVAQWLNCTAEESDYFVVSGQVSSKTYTIGPDRINIMFSPTDIRDISEVSDMLNLKALGNSDHRHFLCYPKTRESLVGRTK